jgi:uncharacterized protein YjeT (DUF2065 family)
MKGGNMGFFLFLISVILMVEGIMIILSPKKMVKFVNELLKVKEPRLWGLLPLFVGILLLFSVSASVLGWLIILLGLAEIGKAIYVFLTPVAKIKSHRWFSLSDNAHRVLGILALILGVLIFVSRV